MCFVLLGACRFGFDATTDGSLTTTDTDGGFGTSDGNLVTDAPPITGTLSCAGIKNGAPGSADGNFMIDPDAGGPAAPVLASCDMTGAGGGWTLVLNYVHAAGTMPPLVVRTADLPLRGSDTLGTDESGTASWGHASNALLASLPFSQIRYTCQTTAHPRVLDFASSEPACLQYVRDGVTICGFKAATTELYAGHTGLLPVMMTHVTSGAGDLALTARPFYRNQDPRADWDLAASIWECDSRSTTGSTIHRVWVR